MSEAATHAVRSVRRRARAIGVLVLTALVAATAVASAQPPPLRETAYREALAGYPASRILALAFPGGAVKTLPARTIRVLLGADQPWAVIESQTALTVTDLGPSGASETIPAQHQVKLTPIVQSGAFVGLTVTDLDTTPDPTSITVTGPVRLSTSSTLWVSIPAYDQTSPQAGRRIAGSLVVSGGFANNLDLVNTVSIESYDAGVLAGQIPPVWGPRAAQATYAGAIAVRSRALASLKPAGAAWDVQADNPLYLGIDGQRASTNAAVAKTAGKVWVRHGRVLSIGFLGIRPLVFAPSPGHRDFVANGPARAITCLAGTACATVHTAGRGLALTALKLAMSVKGHPYVYGATGPGAFDCSGLMYWVWLKNLGFAIPRTASDESKVGSPVARNDLQPGDLIFFADSSGYVGHVGMYIGNGLMIHAANPGSGVKIDSLTQPYFAQTYAGARRYSVPA